MNASSKIESIIAAAQAATTSFSDELKNALFELDDLPEAEQWPAFSALASRLAEVESPQGAGTIAVFIGANVERGRTAESTYAGVKLAFLRWSRALAAAPDDSDDNDPPPEPAVIEGLENLGRSLVTHLARLPHAAEECRRDHKLVAELDQQRALSPGILWVSELINKRSGDLLVLHMPTRRGFRFSYHNLSNNFHLFTLLQGALATELPDTEKVDESVLAAAEGRIQGQERFHDHAWWHYGRGDFPESGLDGSVWGEGSPDEIPVIEGVQVLLLWPSILKSRGWDSGFFGPAIQAAPASVELVSRLMPDETTAWWQKLGLDGPRDTAPRIICPACLSNNPETVPFCLHCEHPFPIHEDYLGRKPPITSAGLLRGRLLAILFLLFLAATSVIIAVGGNSTTGEGIILGIAAAIFIVLAWLVNKYWRKESGAGKG